MLEQCDVGDVALSVCYDEYVALSALVISEMLL